MLLVYGVCMKYFRNREESQDGVIQVFEILVKDIPRFEIQNFKGWLYTVTKNYCLMKLRKDTSERSRLKDISAEIFMESDDVSHHFDEDPEVDMHSRLKLCMEKLKAEQRQCVELFYYQKQSYREIAGHLQISEDKVKSYIQNGKRNLKICLESNALIENAE
jgi:RNA polymerase sigma-70 factor, ECF subfamily